jgi:1-phosphofructokinase
MAEPRVTIFGPNPVLAITVESRAGADDVHVHSGGQGVWVARMAGELGAVPILCSFVGGETGATLEALLGALPGERLLTRTGGSSGCYVLDRRDGDRRVVAQTLAPTASRHEVDDLVSATVASALRSEVLVVCNPWPADTLPLELYGQLVADARANGTPVLVDLSSPRLESALAGSPELVKLNDWELAQFVCGPVGAPAEMDAAVDRLRSLGATTVVVTRGEAPAVVYAEGDVLELVPPPFARGWREGCGDTMMGAVAAAWANGAPLPEALRLGAAAGAANFLRHGLGTGARPVVEQLAARVRLRPRDPATPPPAALR